MSALLSFSEYLPPERLASLGISPAGIELLSDLLHRRAPFDQLLEAREDMGDPPLRALAEILEDFAEYSEWLRELEPCTHPSELKLQTRNLHQLRFINRFGRAKIPKRAHQASLTLWNSAFSLSLKEGQIQALTREDEDPSTFTLGCDQLGTCKIEKLAAHRWLAWRRGRASGHLTVQFMLPEEDLRTQITIRPELASYTERLWPLVLEQLPVALESWLDRKAEREARRTAAAAYRGLLMQQGIQADRLLSIYVGAPRQPVGLTLVTGTGEILEQRRVFIKPGWKQELTRVMDELQAHPVILPSSSPAHDTLDGLRRELPGSHLPIKPAGLKAARESLPQKERTLPPDIASALILARRALDPWSAWSNLDPVELGLAEYQQDLDLARLRETLLAERELCRLDHTKGNATPPTFIEPSFSSISNSSQSLNPLIGSINNLKPGMTVSAVISNIAPFGAFANLGFREEGLIHISELANRRVENPADVVRIGQTVKALVIEVDVARGRIGLSLKRLAKKSDDLSARGGARGERAKALSNLESLFKK